MDGADNLTRYLLFAINVHGSNSPIHGTATSVLLNGSIVLLKWFIDTDVPAY